MGLKIKQSATRCLVCLPSWVIGVVLIFAFGLKCTDPFFTLRFFDDPRYVFSAVIDLVIGVLLLNSSPRPFMFLVAGATFALFLITQITGFVTKATDCGCFGDLPVNALVVTLFDFVAMAYFFAMFITTYKAKNAIGFGNAFQLSSLALILVSIATVVFARRLLPNKCLQQVSIVSCRKDVSADWWRINIRYQNIAGFPVRILGCKSGCNLRSAELGLITVPSDSECVYELLVHRNPGTKVVKGFATLFLEKSDRVFRSDVPFYARIGE